LDQFLKLKFCRPIDLCALAAITIALLAAPAIAFAQTDEIQVYDANIAEQGVFNLMIHSNFTPSGSKTSSFSGGIVPNHSYNGALEWAYGVRPWFEQGLYLPLYSFYSPDRGASLNGFKLRELFVKPHADDHTFFYGVNFEFSYNAKYWDKKRYTSEIRPIIGLHLHPWDIIVNPILDNDYTSVKNLDFAPSIRVAYNWSPKWATALEEYADYGPLHQFDSAGDQYHDLWAVADHPSDFLSFEFGIGFGLTPASDKVILKFMVSRDLNHPKK